MPFVKLDCGILNSTLWFERDAREIFITALLMAEPIELTEPTPQFQVDSLEQTGWSVPPGWYGFVPAANVGIIRRAGADVDSGMAALRLLGSPEVGSRSPDFEGRRLVRVDGGFLVLNYMKYRERDYTTAERSRRYRERKASRRGVTESHRDITQAEGEGKVEVQAKAESKTKNVPAPADARSKRPIFKGTRFVVFEWQLDDLRKMLGPHLEAFDLHEWFFTLSAKADAAGLVVPQRDGGKWLMEQTLQEAHRRGLPVAAMLSSTGKTAGNVAALARFAAKGTTA